MQFDGMGEMDLEGIPYDKPPQVMDYPAYEDQSHEVGGGEGEVRWKRREEL